MACRDFHTFLHWIARSGGKLAAACVLLLWLAPLVCHAEDNVTREYRIKAAFLFNFTKFVEWPSNHFEADDTEIVIGVLGRNPFGNALANVVDGRKVNGRGFIVKEFHRDASAAFAADMLFLAAGEERLLDGPTLEALHRAGVLTVGESRRFAARGGMITLTTRADKVRFEINREPAALGGMRFSAQLLQLATVVRGNG